MLLPARAVTAVSGSHRNCCFLPRTGHGTATSGALLEVGQGRLGVLSSTDAFLFHFRMKPSTEDRIQIKSSPKDSGLVTGRAVEMATLEEAEELEGEGEFHLVYLWLGREAGAEARAAARAQVRGRGMRGVMIGFVRFGVCAIKVEARTGGEQGQHL